MKAIGGLVTSIMIVTLFLCLSASAELSRDELKRVERFVKTLEKSRKADERRDAAYQLGRFEEAQEVVGPLTRALSDRDALVRRQAADSLWRVGEVAAPAVQALRQVLDDSSPGVQVRAAAALEGLGVAEEELVQARVSGLGAKRLRDRILAARDLVGFAPGIQLVGPIAEVAAAEADTASYDMGENYLDPSRVLDRLVRTGETDFVSAVLDQVRAGNPGRRWLLKGLEKLQPKPDGWNQVLTAQLDSPRTEDREMALTLLHERTAEDDGVEEWIGPVIAVLDDQQQGVCIRATQALGKAGGLAAAAAPGLAELLTANPDAVVRKAAASALEYIGDRDQAFPSETLRGVAVAALPALTKAAVKDPDEDVRGAALATLHSLRVAASEVLATFVAAAKNDSYNHNRFKALQYIRDLGTDAKTAIPDLEQIIANDPSNRKMAEQVLENVRTRKPDFSLDLTTAPAAAGSDQALRQLRAAGVDYDLHTFYRAIADLEVDKVGLFLAAGMSAQEPVTDHGMRPLHVLYFGPPGCALHQRPTPTATQEMTRLLLEHGANPNAIDERDNSVLKIAVMACDATIIQMLLDAGADIHAIDRLGMAPFEYTLFSGTDAADPLLAAGYRLPAEKAASYRKAYEDNPKAQELIKRATK